MTQKYEKRRANAGTVTGTLVMLGFAAYCLMKILTFNTDGDVVKDAWAPILNYFLAPFIIGSIIGAWFIWRAGTRVKVETSDSNPPE